MEIKVTHPCNHQRIIWYGGKTKTDGERGDEIFPVEEKKAGRGAQPKEDKMKKLVLLN